MGDTTTSYSYAYGPELKPYATKMIGIGQDVLYNTPFQAYTGQRVAGFSPLQTQAFSNIQGMQPSAYTGQGAALAGLAGTNQFTGANVNQFMNPYVSTMQQDAIRNYAKQLPSFGARSAQVGGLGGSRSAILEADAQSNLQQQLQGIQANAFESARDQFNKANANQLAAAGMLGNLGQQDYTQAMGINQALMGAGALQQAGQQQALNNSYNQFMEERNYPLQQLTNMAALLRGVPMQNVTTSTSLPQISPAAQMLGMAAGFGGFYNAFGGSSGSNTGSTSATGGKAAGGEIKSYKGGGIVSLATGGAVPVDKMGAINASLNQRSQSMPPQQADAQVQQTISAMPESVDWQNAYNMLKYTKDHPVTPPQTKSDTVVVQLAKQIAAQADAEKAAEMQQAQEAQQQQMAMQQMQQPQLPQQGIAGLPTPNVGQNYTPTGITAQPQEASDQQAPTVQAAEGGGIADLQADNVGNHYADGGIVAFDDGGLAAEAEEATYLNNPEMAQRLAAQAEAAAARGSAEAQSWLGSNWAKLTNAGAKISPQWANKAVNLQSLPGTLTKYGTKVANVGKASVLPYLATEGAGYITDLGKVGFNAATGRQRPMDVPSQADINRYYGVEDKPGVDDTSFLGDVGRSGLALLQDVTPFMGGPWEKARQRAAAQEAKAQQPATATTTTPTTSDLTKEDISKYLKLITPTSSGIGTLEIPKVGPVPDVMEGIEKPKDIKSLVKETMDLRKEYGIGDATSNFLKYLDQREAELAGDSKFNRGLVLANAGFKILSTPGQFAQSLGAGGQQFAQDMIAAKKEENAAKMGIYQARMQAANAVEEGKASAITAAQTEHDRQLTRYDNAKSKQADLTAQYTGLGLQAVQAANQAKGIASEDLYRRQQIDLLQKKDQIRDAAIRAYQAGDIETAKKFIALEGQFAEAQSGLGSRLDSTARTKLAGDAEFTRQYNTYMNPKATSDQKAAALQAMRARTGVLGLPASLVDDIVGTNYGPLPLR